jgi:hypothetical protein
MALQDVLLSSGSATFVGEDPVLRALVQRTFPKFLQKTGKPGIDGERLLGGLSFGIARPPVHNSPPDEDSEILPVEVLPLEAHDFTGAKA